MKMFFNCSDILLEHQCKLCNFSTNEKLFYFLHKCEVQRKSEVKYYECDQCTNGSFSILWYFHHQNNHLQCGNKSYKKFKCDQCTFLTMKQCYLDRHKKIMHTCADKIMFFTCEICNMKTKYFQNLKNHILVRHNRHSIEGKLHKCTECDYQTLTQSTMRRHMRAKHTPDHLLKLHNCNICNFQTRDRNNLSRHIYTKHTPDDQLLWFICDICDFKSKSRSNLKAHLLTKHSTGNTKHKCQECDYQAFGKGKLLQHILLKHTPDDQVKWYNCSKCHYRSKVARDLGRHILRKHPNDHIKKSFVEEDLCTICTYKAKNLLDLRNHLKVVHMIPQKRFECHLCVYTTDIKWPLKHHINSKHCSDEQTTWFSCQQCTFKTKRCNNLKSHMLAKHSIENKVKCEECPFSAVSSKILEQHINDKHTPDDVAIWYDCSNCTYKSKNQGNLRAHCSRKHSTLARK